IQSEDGRFSFSPGFLMKLRYVANWREHGRADGNDDSEEGFEVRQMKLIATGNVFSPDLTYRLQLESDRTDGHVFLQDLYARYHFASDWSFRLGQFKDIVFHEETTSDGLVVPVERSLINALIGGARTDRTQGAS